MENKYRVNKTEKEETYKAYQKFIEFKNSRDKSPIVSLQEFMNFIDF